MNDPLWKIEERLWTGDGEDVAAALDPACMMAFPQVGILNGAPAILESLRGAPRWVNIEIKDQTLARPEESLAVLAYRARAKRLGDESAYAAVCTSTYVARQGVWRMVQHQQTPV